MKPTLAAALLFTLAACAGASSPADREVEELERVPPPEIEFTIADQGVTGIPDEIHAGLTKITVTNSGKDRHVPAFLAVHIGVSPQKVGLALADEDFRFIFTRSTIAGSVSSVGDIDLLPGDSGSITTGLKEGNYLLVDPEAKRFEPGYFEVLPEGEEVKEEPPADYEIEAGEYFFEMPQTLPAGVSTFAVTNNGVQSHEMLIMDKNTEKEEAAMLLGAPGTVTWVDLELSPGEYTVACFFPDVKGDKVGKPHAQMGMKTTVTVE